MGQAKRRGTFEQRKAAAIERSRQERMAMAHVLQRRPSPKHVALMAAIAAMAQTSQGGEESGMSESKCKRCGAEMKPGKAIEQTWTPGIPDFPGDPRESIGQTMNAGGPGRLIECLKCQACGWSVTYE